MCTMAQSFKVYHVVNQLTATDSWHKALEKGSDVCAVFLDLSKAFDKVPHRPLMDKLASLHVDRYVLRWLSDYLCQRSQCVAVNGEISTSSKVISGVPQGSVLGPLLFLIYINGISEVELHNGTIILYADDILLHRRIQSQADYLLLQKDIDSIRAWFMANYMMLNIGKCKYMVISRKRFPIQPMFSLSISNIPLEKVSTFKYLGVWISDDLKWSKHIEQITKKATKQAGLIYRRFYPYSNSGTLKQLYLSQVRPHLEYAVPVWDPHCKLHITALERVQKFALKIAFKSWGDSYETLLLRSGLQQLSERRSYLRLCYLFQIINGNFVFPNPPIARRQLEHNLRNVTHHLMQPFARTSAYQYSFFPNTISDWNSLPASIRSCPSISAFKYNLVAHL